MSYPQLALPYDIITPDYFPIEPNESIHDYSKRFCEYLLSTHAIDLDRPLVIAGYSFGSAVAQELSNIVACKAIILIGGLRSNRELSPIVRWCGRWIAPRVPLIVYRLAGLFLPLAMRRISEISREDLDLCQQMYLNFPEGMFRRGFALLVKWEGCPVHVPMLRIRGIYDHIVSKVPKQEDIPVVSIEDAKHLVNLSKPKIVNGAIEQFIQSLF